MMGEMNNQSEIFVLVNGRIILPDAIADEKAVLVKGKRIAAILDRRQVPHGIAAVDVGGRYIAPGLIDIHTHGAVGYSFNEPSFEAFAAITHANMTRGVTSILATLATASIPDLVRCLVTGREWMSQGRLGSQVLGIHLEGPYFSFQQRGAQDPQQLRSPDDGTVETLLQFRDILKMVSFAPELPGALDLTRRLTELQIVPAAGHSAARDEHLQAAIRAGLRHTIHIWSGQSTTIREGPWRKPGLLEATLAFDELTGEMISDNRHLPPTLMKLAFKCLGPDRLCIVSDATNGAGLPEGSRFRMGGMEYEVHDGVGMLLDHSAFAGSTTFINDMVHILATVAGIPLAQVVRMASLTPARVIGFADRKGSLEEGKDADIAIFEDDFKPWRIMIAGKWVYGKEELSHDRE